MAKRDRSTTEKKIEKAIEDGRGKGQGAEYKPWLTIRDVPSLGMATRIKGWKTNRVHHLLSKMELHYFYTLEWSDAVIDIREQYPLLPLERTLEISKSLGIKHPVDPKSQTPIVMTTDFLITVNTLKGQEIRARTIKSSSELKGRTIEKFAIEQQFYNEQEIDWGIVTDIEKPNIFIRNIEWLYNAKSLENFKVIDINKLNRISLHLFEDLINSKESLSFICLSSDEKYGLKPGTCLFTVKHMLANKRWLVDMNNEIDPLCKVELFTNK
jgi:hypothetical protein